MFNSVHSLNPDVVAVFRPENIFYFTGYWGEGIAVIKKNIPFVYLIVPKLEIKKAEDQSKDCQIIVSDRGGDMLSNFIGLSSNSNVLSDCNDIDFINYVTPKLKNFSLTYNHFLAIREVKDTYEIAQISKASAIIDSLYKIFEEEAKIGSSERDLEALILSEAIKRGMNPVSYTANLDPLIIASGKNGSYPHALISNRELEQGDLVVVDLTLRYNGYVGDATRTFAVGQIDPVLERAYNVVKLSQQEGIECIEKSSLYSEIDKRCRESISSNGYGDFFIHSTGHGVGLDVHELPWISSGSNNKIKHNTVFTIEPGIYIEEKFGIRIEDTILFNSSGTVNNLNGYTKDLMVVE